MHNLSKNEKVAVWVALAIVLFFILGLGFVSLPFVGGFTAAVPEDEGEPSETDGLIINDQVEGTGEVAVAGKKVTVHYTGTFPDGTVFDSSVSRGVPLEFVLGSGYVIEGWDRGLEGMKVGGKRTLIIPPELGYGPEGYGPIPGNQTLHFEVELLGVE